MYKISGIFPGEKTLDGISNKRLNSCRSVSATFINSFRALVSIEVHFNNTFLPFLISI